MACWAAGGTTGFGTVVGGVISVALLMGSIYFGLNEGDVRNRISGAYSQPVPCSSGRVIGRMLHQSVSVNCRAFSVSQQQRY